MDFRWTGVAVYQPAAAMLADPVAYCPPVDAEHGDAGRPAFGQRVAPGLRHDRQHDSDMRFDRSEEHTSELQSLMRISYAVFCLKKKKQERLACMMIIIT